MPKNRNELLIQLTKNIKQRRTLTNESNQLKRRKIEVHNEEEDTSTLEWKRIKRTMSVIHIGDSDLLKHKKDIAMQKLNDEVEVKQLTKKEVAEKVM